MGPEQLFNVFGLGITGILSDVYVVFMAVVNILIVLVGGRIIYAAISHEPIIPAGIGGSSEDQEYDGLLDQEEKKYHQGILRGNAKYEVSERHKYDL